MPKTTFLQIRCSPEDRARMARLAEVEHLDVSTWARRLLLQAVDRWESPRSATTHHLRVAEKPTPYTSRPAPAKSDKGRSTGKKGRNGPTE